ncbi:MAG: Ku protein [Bdellovibrio sp.]|nr:Ku protein [Methylotenera sp.]
MPHAIWKGAISFGLVHVPVTLYPAAQDISIDFDWLDKRTMDPVGYKRINKISGKEIEKENIVKGIKQDNGDYIVISDEEIKAAYPKTTQTIAIESFVKSSEISFNLLEQPYFLEPGAKADKVYALLREAMKQAEVIGIARVVLHTKEHLAALIPIENCLMLNTIRWASEIRTANDIKLPASGKKVLKESELKMAKQLINELTSPWQADDYKDTFSDSILKLVDQKVKAGEGKTVTAMEDSLSDAADSNVLDLTELLAKSLQKRK